MLTLNFKTSSILAILPLLTQDRKKLGATLTPIASLVMPVLYRALFNAITRKVPNNTTSNFCVHFGNDKINLYFKKKKFKNGSKIDQIQKLVRFSKSRSLISQTALKFLKVTAIKSFIEILKILPFSFNRFLNSVRQCDNIEQQLFVFDTENSVRYFT